MALRLPDDVMPPTADLVNLRLYRLPETMAAPLRDLARGTEESDAGVCCTYLADHITNAAHYEEHAMLAVESCANASLEMEDSDGYRLAAPRLREWKRKIVRSRATIRILRERGANQHASVLMVAHGYPDPIVHSLSILFAIGKDLASLARYTDATEAYRLEMVRRDAADLSRRFNDVREEYAGQRGTFFYKAFAEREEHIRRLVNSGGAIDLMRRREKHRQSDAAITSSDALRDALAGYPEPGPTRLITESGPEITARRVAWQGRKVAHESRLNRFLAAVKLDALRMISEAEVAYRDAWYATSSIR